jgi:hypothetical protein
VPVRPERCGSLHGARPRSRSVRQRYLRSVPQNHGVAGYLA